MMLCPSDSPLCHGNRQLSKELYIHGVFQWWTILDQVFGNGKMDGAWGYANSNQCDDQVLPNECRVLANGNRVLANGGWVLVT